MEKVAIWFKRKNVQNCVADFPRADASKASSATPLWEPVQFPPRRRH